ncbi:MAG: DEAD/DEAH box helicase [Myxococcota bacterium]
MDDSDNLLAALQGIEKPLRFASGNGFARLERIVGLEQTLARGASQAQACTSVPAFLAALTQFIENLPAAQSSREWRIAQLKNCLRQLEQLMATVRQPQAEAEMTSPLTETENLDINKPRGRRPDGVRPLALFDIRPQGGKGPKSPNSTNRAAASKSTRRAASGVVTDSSMPDATSSSLLHPESSVQFIKGVGPKIADALAARGIYTVTDLLRFLPKRYEDRRYVPSIGTLPEGIAGIVEGEIVGKSYRAFRGRRQLELTLADHSGAVQLKWFRVPSRSFAERFSKGQRLRATGVVKRYRGQLQIAHPETTFLASDNVVENSPDTLAEETLSPVYGEIEGIGHLQLRKIVAQALLVCDAITDSLPSGLRRKRQLPALSETLRALHAPTPGEARNLLAWRSVFQRRMIYDELLLLQLAVLQRKAESARLHGRAIVAQPLHEVAEQLFDFSLTGAQHRVLGEIQADLRCDSPMHRLLQGDVGSGKTAVAFAAAIAVAKAGMQVVIMAPTEILAEQHMRSALRLLTRVGLRVGLLTGSISAAERRKTLAQLEGGHIQVVVGTHAIIQETVRFKNLGLAVIDEQHRFGVMQRARLMSRGTKCWKRTPYLGHDGNADFTLAMTVYGDLDVSVIDELPPGRQPIETRLHRDNQRQLVYRCVRDAVNLGRQAYVVFPLVEESDKEGMERLRDATGAAEVVGQWGLSGVSVGLLHGRMSSDDKERVSATLPREPFRY